MTDDERYAAALDQILELVVLLHGDMSRSLAARGLTSSRITLLWILRRMGPCPQRDLAEALGVTPRAITGLVDGLAESGHVTREPHPTDRRAALVTLTATGVETVETLAAEQREFGRQLFAAMPPERFEGLVAGLGDVLGALHDHGLSVSAEVRP